MDFQIRDATRKDAESLASRLRESDQVEIWRASGMEPLEALLDSLEASDDDMCWAAYLDGPAEVMFGANSIIEGELGGIWMLGSDRIYESRHSFLRHCEHFLALMHTRYPYLTNFVDVHHQAAHRWMLKLGFQPVQFVKLRGQFPFIQYISEASNV